MLGEGGAPVDDTKNHKAGRIAFFQCLQEGPLVGNFQGPSTATPTVAATINVQSYSIRPNSIVGEQRTKLDYCFNMYQYYRLWGFKVMFRPRNTESIAKYATATANQATFQSVEILSSDTQIVIVPDRDDTIVRAVLDELLQAKMLPGSQSFSSTERGQLFVRANTLEGDSISDQTGPTDGYFLAPTPSKWLATKTNTAGASTQNAAVDNYGFKIYSYNPYFGLFNPVASPVVYTSVLGTIAIQTYWQFKDLDNRALFTPTVLTSLMSGNPVSEVSTFSLDSMLNRSSGSLVPLLDDDMEENGDPVEKPPVLKRQRVDGTILATSL